MERAAIFFLLFFSACSPRFSGDLDFSKFSSLGIENIGTPQVDEGPYGVVGGGSITFSVSGNYMKPAQCQVVVGSGTCKDLTYTAADKKVEEVQIKIVDGRGASSNNILVYNLGDVQNWHSANNLNGNYDDSAGWNDGDAVVRWANAGLLENADYKMSEAEFAPLWRSNIAAFRNLPGVDFSRGQQCLLQASSPLFSSQENTVFIVFLANRTSEAQTLFFDGDPSSPFLHYRIDPRDETLVLETRVDSPHSHSVAFPATANIAHVVGSTFDGRTNIFTGFFDGNSITSAIDRGSKIVVRKKTLRRVLGAQENSDRNRCSSRLFTGHLGEILVYTRALSTDEAQILQCFFSNQYDLGLKGC